MKVHLTEGPTRFRSPLNAVREIRSIFYRGARGRPHGSGILQLANSMRKFNVVIRRDEEGMYVGSVPQLPGCHTQGKSLDELMARMREAVELCLDVEADLLENLLSS